MESALSIVQAWQDAVNRQDIDRLLDISAPDIAIIGPQGVGSGHQLLRDWLARAGLTLTTTRIFQRGDTIVLAQHGTWHAGTSGSVIGEAEVASRFRVRDQQVIEFERYDDLATALNAARLTSTDEQPIEP